MNDHLTSNAQYVYSYLHGGMHLSSVVENEESDILHHHLYAKSLCYASQALRLMIEITILLLALH